MKTLKLTPVLLFVLLLSNFSFSQTGWSNLNPSPTNKDLHTFHMINSLTGYVDGEASTILKTTDAGLTWTVASIPLELFATEHGTYTYPVYIDFSSANIGYAAGADFYKTTNGGASWNKYPRQTPYFIPNSYKFLTENIGYTRAGGILKTTNGGVQWTALNTPSVIGGVPANITSAEFFSEGTGMGICQNYMVVRTTNDGANWTKILDSNSSRNLSSISFINSQTGFISGSYGKIYKTTDAGLTWSVITSNPAPVVALIKFINENTGYAKTPYDDNYLIKKTTDGGATWQNIPLSLNYVQWADINDIYFDGTGLGLISCANGIIYRTTDEGIHWNCVTSKIGFTNYLYDLSFINENTGYIVDVTGYLLKTTDAGNNFTKRKIDVTYLSSVNFPSENTGYAGAYKNGGSLLIKTTNAGVSWDSLISDGFTNQIYKINFINNNTGFAIFNLGRNLMRTSDGGTTWSEIRSGESIDFSFKNNIGYYSIVYNSGNIYTNSSAIYKTTDLGATWNLADSLSGIGITGFSIINSNISYAKGSKIYKTTNGGNDWFVSSDKFALSMQFINENTGYITGQNFMNWPTGYKTIDGGLHWHEQNSNETKFYFANEQTGYSIGDGGLIRKTTDGGGFVGIQNNSGVINDYYLSQNYPNPFNPETKIQFAIPKSGLVKIVVYDMLGREVKELVNEFKQQGSYDVSFNGASLSSGIYFYKLITDDFIETKKMILVK